jgi:hypothetical protein
MPHPAPVTQQFSFERFGNTNPNTPLPGQKVDAEFAAVRKTVNETGERLKLIQADDGQVARGAIGMDQMRGGVIDALLLRMVERIENGQGKVLRLVYVFSELADGVKSTFTLSRPLPSARQAVVTVAGAVQTEGSFLVSGMTSLVFPGPVPSGQIVEVRYFDGDIPLDRFTGDGVKSAFQLSRALPDAPWGWVSVSGVTQHVEAYSIVGRELRFVSPPPADVPVEVRYFWDLPLPASVIIEAECCEC